MKNKFSFSKIELKHIALAITALAFSFEFVLFRKEIFPNGWMPNLQAVAIFFLQSLFIIGLSFVLHELGHKYIAQKKGLWAEFRAWPLGLLIALGMAITTGIIFAAPGAVVIGPGKKTTGIFTFKDLEKRDVGLIGIIGAAINIVLAIIFGLLAIVFPLRILMIGAQINAWLAIFNLIPIAMLDGAKVFYWNKGVWLGTFLVSIFIFILTVML